MLIEILLNFLGYNNIIISNWLPLSKIKNKNKIIVETSKWFRSFIQ